MARIELGIPRHGGLHGLYFGSAVEAWESASALSSQVHIVWVDEPYRRVLSIMPPMYDDLWTGAKGMYKVEPAIAPGGEVVIYAPHIDEVSYTYGELLDEIGYHCRDYFLKQWDKFKDYPGAVLAHATHLKGLGAYDPDTGVETPRIQVTLATGIPRERGVTPSAFPCSQPPSRGRPYLDSATVDGPLLPAPVPGAPLGLAEWEGREAEGILVLPRAGEMLYKVRREQ